MAFTTFRNGPYGLGYPTEMAKRTPEEERAYAERRAKEAKTREWRARTLDLVRLEFPEVMPRVQGGVDQLAETISKSRWLEESSGSHYAWQQRVESAVRNWDEKLHQEFHAYLASYLWADRVEGTPEHLRQKAITLRAQRAAGKSDAAEKATLERMRAQETQRLKHEEEERQMKAALKAEVAQLNAERERIAAEARLAADLEELVLDDEREKLGAGTW